MVSFWQQQSGVPVSTSSLFANKIAASSRSFINVAIETGAKHQGNANVAYMSLHNPRAVVVFVVH